MALYGGRHGALQRRPLNGAAIGLVVAGAALGTGLSVTASASRAPRAKSEVIVKEVKNPKFGTILASTKGHTLYVYMLDKPGKVACTTHSCTALWPPLVLAKGRRPAGPKGLSGLGTVKDPSGRIQVTYRGHPLYLFSGDKSAGTTNGQGVLGVWFVAKRSMSKLTASSSTTTSAPTTSAPSSTNPTTTTSAGTSPPTTSSPPSPPSSPPSGGGPTTTTWG